MAKLEEFQELRKKAEQLQRDADRAEGALQQTLKQLQREFDCPSLEAAESLLKKLKREEAIAKREYEKALFEFQKHWGDLLDGEDE